MNKKVLVMGGGVAGMTVALELAERGIEVYLVEKFPGIGGKAINYCCKATEVCNKCGTCLVPQIKAKVEGSWGIKLIVNSEVKDIAGETGNYRVIVRFLTGSRGLDLGAETTLEIDAIVIAVGSEVFDATQKGEFGYKKLKGVITTWDLEIALQEHGDIAEAFCPDIQRIGFIQCVGSRDLQVGNPYCSRICCMNTSKQANLIRYNSPNIAVDVFYMDLQTFGKNCQEFLNQCENVSGVRYIRSIPSKIFRYPYNYLTVQYSVGTGSKTDQYDLIVLAPGIIPVQGLKELWIESGLRNNSEGFIAESDKRGIFAAGSCTGPMDIPQTIVHAKAVAGKVIGYLYGRENR